MKNFLEKLKTNRQEIENYIKTAKGSDKQNMIAYLGQMRSGKSIATIGVLCPLLWMSILLGQSIGAIAFNFCHSMVYVAIGLFMYFSAEKKGLKHIEEKNANGGGRNMDWGTLFVIVVVIVCMISTGKRQKRK